MGLVIMIVVVIGGLLILAQMEEPDDPSFTHECDVDELLRESNDRQARKRNHIYSSGLMLKK